MRTLPAVIAIALLATLLALVVTSERAPPAARSPPRALEAAAAPPARRDRPPGEGGVANVPDARGREADPPRNEEPGPSGADQAPDRAPDLVPLHLEYVSAIDGRPIEVEPPLLDEEPVSGDGPACQHTLNVPRVRHIYSGTLRLRCFPEGWAAHSKFIVGRRQPISLWARAARLAVPLWPEARVRVRVETAEEESLSTPKIFHVELGGRALREWVPESLPEAGAWRLRGIPDVPGERLQVMVAGYEWGAAEVTLRGDRGVHPLTVDADGARILSEVEVPDRLDGLRSRGSAGVPTKEQPAPEGSGSLEVVVRRYDGSSAGPVRVMAGCSGDGWTAGRQAPCDESGVVRFDRLPAGRWIVGTWAVGLVPLRAELDLGPGESRRLALEEPPGWTLRLRVAEADGRPLPFVEVRAGGGCYALIEKGVQQLRIFTDLDGRVVLPHLPPGRTTVTLALGSRRKEVEIDESTSPVYVVFP